MEIDVLDFSHAWQVTAILYLNDGHDCDVAPWNGADSADGGRLRCFLGTEPSDFDGRTAKETMQIDPVGGRLVLFDAQAVLHAVLPTHRR